jgi:hypothetical protein
MSLYNVNLIIMLQLRITVGLKQIVSILGIHSTKTNRSKIITVNLIINKGMTHEYNQRWSEHIPVS